MGGGEMKGERNEQEGGEMRGKGDDDGKGGRKVYHDNTHPMPTSTCLWGGSQRLRIETMTQ